MMGGALSPMSQLAGVAFTASAAAAAETVQQKDSYVVPTSIFEFATSFLDADKVCDGSFYLSDE